MDKYWERGILEKISGQQSRKRLTEVMERKENPKGNPKFRVKSGILWLKDQCCHLMQNG